MCVCVCVYVYVYVYVYTHTQGRNSTALVSMPVCVCVRWSVVSEFGQGVNKYSAYSVIMVPVSPCRSGGLLPNKQQRFQGDEAQAPSSAPHLDIY